MAILMIRLLLLCQYNYLIFLKGLMGSYIKAIEIVTLVLKISFVILDLNNKLHTLLIFVPGKFMTGIGCMLTFTIFFSDLLIVLTYFVMLESATRWPQHMKWILLFFGDKSKLSLCFEFIFPSNSMTCSLANL